MPPRSLYIPLPRHWPSHVGAAMLHVVSLARFSIAEVRGGFARSPLAHVRLRSELQRLKDELALLQAQLRIKDARMARIEPHHRPHYLPHERRDILTLRAAAGWSLARTAREFLVCPDTLRHWLHALQCHDTGPLLPPPPPVNRFPDFVHHTIAMLKALQPSMGARRIADTLCRAGLHLSASTARRTLRAKPRPRPTRSPHHSDAPDLVATSSASKPSRTVTARDPGHLWHIDLTVMPIFAGFWVSWLPNALHDCWPFCWHLVVVIDHKSRAVLCAMAYPSKPHGDDLCRLLDYALRCASAPPRYIVSDKGLQFRSAYKAWCAAHDVTPRFGAVGQHGSIALIERFMRTLKTEGLRRILVPLTLADINHELALFCRWYNVHRPHHALGGATPAEIRDKRLPLHQLRGYETRPRHPLRSKLSERRRIHALQRVTGLELRVTHVEDRHHLPIVELRPAA